MSIIIPALNADKYIERAVRSCLKQTFNDYDIIVINDGSTDNTGKILGVFGDRIQVITLETNGGRSRAINIGIRSSLSQYIVRVDADDYINEDLLKIEFMYLTMNKDMDAVACDYVFVDDDENIMSRRNCDLKPIGCGVMFRKDKIIEIGLYDENFDCSEDDDLRIRFLKKYNIHRIPLPLYRYRRHLNNITDNQEAVELGFKRLEEKHGSSHC